MDHFYKLPFRSVNSTFNLTEHLFPEEELISQFCDYIGIYNHNTKLPPPLDVVTGWVTTHRIILSPSSSTHNSSSNLSRHADESFPHGLYILLSSVRQTEFYAGFLSSSPKVSLTLASEETVNETKIPSTSAPPVVDSSIKQPQPSRSVLHTVIDVTETDGKWFCPLCGFNNPRSDSGLTARTLKCQMCGVSKDASKGAYSSSALSSASSTPPPPPIIPSSSILSSAPLSTSYSPVSEVPPKKKEVAGISCEVCTFLNHPSLVTCEMCDSPLPSRKPSGFASTRLSESRPATETSNEIASVNREGEKIKRKGIIRLSFRRGGVKEFYTALKRGLEGRAWDGGLPREHRAGPSSSSSAPAFSSPSTSLSNASSGIDRILNALNMEDSQRAKTLESSLKDLDSLMKKASDMVKLAQTLSARLPPPNSSSGSDSSDETLLQTTLSMSLPAPAITKDMLQSKEEGLYLKELAKELGGYLQQTQKGERKKRDQVWRLDEVWAGWNRARGVALIPPKTFRQTLAYLPTLTEPAIHLKVFSQGGTNTCILHTPYYSSRSFQHRIERALSATRSMSIEEAEGLNGTEDIPSLTTIQIALSEDLGVGMVKEMMSELEIERGVVVRDEQVSGSGGGGEGWFANLIRETVWKETNTFVD